MMKKKLYKVARDTNSFLKKFLNKQNKTSLIINEIWLISRR